MTPLWFIVAVVCLPMGPDSRECSLEVLRQPYGSESACETDWPYAVADLRASLDAGGWGAAWIERVACRGPSPAV